jgi:NACalpha-BTF3-like transcription factor
MQQANVPRERAVQALIDAKGDMAQAILTLTT